jgi:hypothetical protein
MNRRQEIETRLRDLEEERLALQREFAALPHESAPQLPRSALGSPARDVPPTTSDERIALFTQLFRCRGDIFPRLWENQSKGTKGYSPACQVEWVRGICEKPRVKCGECPNKAFIPMDDQIIRGHLHGTFTIGTYAIRVDDSCIFLERYTNHARCDCGKSSPLPDHPAS